MWRSRSRGVQIQKEERSRGVELIFQNAWSKLDLHKEKVSSTDLWKLEPLNIVLLS